MMKIVRKVFISTERGATVAKQKKIPSETEIPVAPVDPTEESIHDVAHDTFAEIQAIYDHQKIAAMKIPEGKSPLKERVERSTSQDPIFGIWAKEDFYAKKIAQNAEAWSKELEVEVLEKRLKKVREEMKTKFHDYLKKIQERR